MSFRATLSLALGCLALPGLASGQTVRGVATERGAITPVPGVVVLLIDGSGSTIARSLTNERGEFRVVGPKAGAYRLRTLRIGYLPITSDIIHLGIGREIIQSIELTGVRVSLDTIRVVDRSACRIARDSATATFAVWEQVRAALTATQVTASSGIAATIVGYERVLDRRLRVREQTSFIRSGYVTQPWQSLTATSLHRAGYVTTGAGDSVVYHAPGLEVLLSPQFLDDHCFRLTTSKDQTRLGLIFDPTRARRRMPEIRGTIWLDRASSELRDLEFTYVNLPTTHSTHAGGDMQFVRMKNGTWIISRWSIRAPLVARLTEPIPGLATAGRGVSSNYGTMAPKVIGAHVSGGELALATSGSDTLWSRPPLRLRGVVSDSVTGAKVYGARVSLDGTNLEDITDPEGRFTITGVLPGEYTLAARSPSLDSLGAVVHSELTVTDSTTTVNIRLPTAKALAGALCRQPELAGKLSWEGIILGRVEILGDSLPPRNALVVAEWYDPARRMVIKHDVRTNERGTYRMCGVPLATPLFLRAVTEGGLAAVTELRIHQDQRFARADLFVDRKTPASASLAGFVLVDSTQQPIAGAEVALPDLAKSVLTGERGEFRIAELPPGTHEVVVRRIGYGPLNAQISFVPNETVERRVFLTRTVMLDTVAVTASAILPDFEENRRIGLGHFLTRADLAKMEHLTLTAIFGQLPSAQIVSDPIAPSKKYVISRRKGCYALVYLDRILVYGAKEEEDEFDIASITPDRIEAIEFYASPAQTPLKYSTLNSQCGVLVIHTRRSP